jgi:hypothetical protein
VWDFYPVVRIYCSVAVITQYDVLHNTFIVLCDLSTTWYIVQWGPASDCRLWQGLKGPCRCPISQSGNPLHLSAMFFKGRKYLFMTGTYTVHERGNMIMYPDTCNISFILCTVVGSLYDICGNLCGTCMPTQVPRSPSGYVIDILWYLPKVRYLIARVRVGMYSEILLQVLRHVCQRLFPMNNCGAARTW